MDIQLKKLGSQDGIEFYFEEGKPDWWNHLWIKYPTFKELTPITEDEYISIKRSDFEYAN